jgi:hypothetical protein
MAAIAAQIISASDHAQASDVWDCAAFSSLSEEIGAARANEILVEFGRYLDELLLTVGRGSFDLLLLRREVHNVSAMSKPLGFERLWVCADRILRARSQRGVASKLALLLLEVDVAKDRLDTALATW